MEIGAGWEPFLLRDTKKCYVRHLTIWHFPYSNKLSRCAIGANLTSRTNLGVPEPAAEFFTSRAKTLLEIEMDSPTVATVQALVIMSASEAAFTRDARGWLYSGLCTPSAIRVMI